MGDLSRHFFRYEFACKCGCGKDTVDAELIRVLEALRELYGPITITSGVRCKAHNAEVGGSPKSKHLEGKAADFKVAGLHPDEVSHVLEVKYFDKYGIGRYNGRTHVDVRSAKARWDLR